jgi:hypothetical protein
MARSTTRFGMASMHHDLARAEVDFMCLRNDVPVLGFVASVCGWEHLVDVARDWTTGLDLDCLEVLLRFVSITV